MCRASYGDFAIAVAPQPGAYLFNTSVYYETKVPEPLLPNDIDSRFEGSSFADLVRGFWVSETKIFGLTYLAAFRFQVLDIEGSATIDTTFGAFDLNDKNFDVGDFGFIPLSLYWNSGKLHFNFYEAINAPTAKFDKTRLANVSLNHWVFDSIFSITWLDPARGIDLSLASGLIYNTKNPDTDYKSGVEFHLDYMVNKFITPEFAVGLHGSYYRQLTGDTGSGALQGSFKGKASTIGPAIIYTPTINQRKFIFSTKWHHEFNTKNRFEGDLYFVTGAVKF